MKTGSQANRQLFNDYLQSLAIALAISVPFSFSVGRSIPISRIVLILVSAFTFGTGFFVVGALRGRIRVRSFVLNVLAQSALIFATLVACTYVMIWLSVASHLRGNAFRPEAFAATAQFEFSRTMLPFGLIGLLASMAINSFFQISRKMGPGVLWNWVTGKYHTPREEPLIFMFLDMKDSTTLAEQLGAIKFSALVRDFFHDMTLPLLASQGKVSHYIGDEAVIYWRPDKGLKDAKCLAFFFEFQNLLRSRSAHYQKTYGLVPEFKAGIHLGPVVATEVGDIKSEIVFHGDVLNTAARIQSMCNETGCELLTSGQLKSAIPDTARFNFRSLGGVHLKGKAQEVALYAVEKPSQ